MAKKPLPTPTELRQLLDYEPATGTLVWRKRGPEYFTDRASTPDACASRWNGNYAGKVAGSKKANGYIALGIWGTDITAHRIAWAISHGEWPPEDIDHINGDRADNRLVNLRSVSRAMNMRNQRFKVRTPTGVVGVVITRGGRFLASIGCNESYQYLGTYLTKEEAVEARCKAERRLGYHENHGSERTTV